ncbi:hypothetical protein ACWD4Z_04730 [Streptomyces antibioticus]|uniref:hypothetical protein n=1 Tax=Streptomyces antibioticus TaxID=1890 RepID=UPI00224F3EE1|nr:hypothetical protein [Streptomyces antibioticus]MCX5167178.1 hypothetical protein [Streptomyces antibioticus]
MSARRTAATALLLLVTLTVGGCSGDSEPADDSTDVTSSASADPSTAADTEETEEADASDGAPADDTSIKDVLDAAGVDDDLVNRLGEVGDANGYGLGVGVETDLEQRRGLAALQVDTCRNVAVGYRSWDGIQNSDVGGGATEEQAAAMADFLRTEYCPHVAPLKEGPLPEQTLGGPTEDEQGGRGLATTRTWWEHRYQRVSWTKECAAQTGQPLGDPLAYRIARDAVMCAEVPRAQAKGRFVAVDVVFAAPVGADRAGKTVLSLLPSGASVSGETEGTNPDWSPLDGGCLAVDFRADGLAKVLADGPGDPEPWAHGIYYSDGATEDGAVGPYTGKVKQILLGTGKNEPSADGETAC